MMTVPMDDKSSVSSGRELAHCLFKKNRELEDGLRRSAQSKIPQDPNAWIQMRENYEAIVLEDHEFSEKHEVEYCLWQLHYRRIEEFRSHINAASSTGIQGGKKAVHPERIKKIRAVFKSFLSEATGFYHDLILKIRAKYGLPMENFPEVPNSQVFLIKDENLWAEKREGMLSCHRCLIYLGDLSRYKGLYGEADSVKRDYAAAYGYYIQSSSLWPSSGNPHHQLAILASYSGDELVAVYRYFRSLAVESPFSTARDNLIIAFEKNRQSYSQLFDKGNNSSAKMFLPRSGGRGRGKGENLILSEDFKEQPDSNKGREYNAQEVFKTFSIRFVRLNGILFTRTSLEMFEEIFILVMSGIKELLSSGPQEFNFGYSATDNGSTILMLITILIYTVHNVKRESDGLSYAEILQRKVLLENAFTLTYEFSGHIVKRCLELDDSTSSYFLPGILVFVEWLASHQDIARGLDVEEKQAAARSFFWNQFVSFINKLMLGGPLYIDSLEDKTRFLDTRFDAEETGNRLALWEDFELRGFTPLAPAHSILDFSRKHSFGSDRSSKEKELRVQRILAAGRALTNVVRIDEKGIFFDSTLSRFVISLEPPSHANLLNASFSDVSELGLEKQNTDVNVVIDLGALHSSSQLYEEDDEEEIVFQPVITEKNAEASISTRKQAEITRDVKNVVEDDLATHGGDLSGAFEKLSMSRNLGAGYASASHSSPTDLQQNSPNILGCVADKELALSNGLWSSDFVESGFTYQLLQEGMFAKSASQEGLGVLHASAIFPPVSPAMQDRNMNSFQERVSEDVIPYQHSSAFPSASNYVGFPVKQSTALVAASGKNSVSRPVRHFGPPPGFNPFPPKNPEISVINPVVEHDGLLTDDYSWLDGYQVPPKSMGIENNTNATTFYPRIPPGVSSMSSSVGIDFPFPGKQIPAIPPQAVNENMQNFQIFDQLKHYSEKQLPRGNLHPTPSQEQYQTPTLWSGNYFVRGPFAS